MNIRRPNQQCPLTCAFRNSAQCVCNLVAVSGEKSPISLGLRLGLGHFYGTTGVPPCVQGNIGTSYWSTAGATSTASPA